MFKALCEKITEKTGLECAVTDVLRGGVIKKGIRISAGDMSPVIYPDDFPGDLDQQAEAIAAAIKTAPAFGGVDDVLDIIGDYEKARPRLQACLRPVTNYPGQPTRPFLNMELYVRLMLSEEASCVVTDKMLDMWGIDAAGLFMSVPTPRAVTSVFDLNGCTSTPAENVKLDGCFVVISNDDKRYGAGVILDNETLAAIADNNGGALYILPSSIHECLVLSADHEPEILKMMVQGVNKTDVKPEERLSDSVYLWKDGALSIAA